MFTIGSAAETYEDNKAPQSTSSSSNTINSVSEQTTRKMTKALEIRYAFLRNHNLSVEEDVEFQDFIRVQAPKMMPTARPVSSGTIATSTSTSTSVSLLNEEVRSMPKVNLDAKKATSMDKAARSRHRGSKSQSVKKFFKKTFYRST